MQITGKVIQGEGKGRQLGYPTANIDREEYRTQQLRCVLGVYAGFVTIPERSLPYRAGIVVGPMEADGLPKLEAHLIGFVGDLYGQRITYRLVEYLRPLKPYETETALIADIAADIEIIKSMDLK